jgi:hypothetical protein
MAAVLNMMFTHSNPMATIITRRTLLGGGRLQKLLNVLKFNPTTIVNTLHRTESVFADTGAVPFQIFHTNSLLLQIAANVR